MFCLPRRPNAHQSIVHSSSLTTSPASLYAENHHQHHVMRSPEQKKTPPIDALPMPVQHPLAIAHSHPSTLAALWPRAKNILRLTPSPFASHSGSLYADSDSPSTPEDPDTFPEKIDVDEIVVDRTWQDCGTNTIFDNEGDLLEKEKVSTPHPLHVDSPQRSGWQTDRSFRHGRFETCTRWLRDWWMDFFSSRFYTKEGEAHFKQESWRLQKRLAFWAAVFMIVNWVLGCVFIPKPVVLADKVFYYMIGPLMTLPLVPMVLCDVPHKYSVFWQFYLCLSIWSWSFYQVLFSFLCGYYGVPQGSFSCGTKDFLIIFYYTSALQTIALFGMNLKRLPATIGAIFFFVFSSALILNFKLSWIKNSINFLVYEAALVYMHYQREHAERRLFTLRETLKHQFKETQKAQINERKAADSKRRLTSYVRVPLNTALLAVQNMEASGMITKRFEIEFTALEGSLAMMSKVLNDVLDFNRMDSGKFESVHRPYLFHQVMLSMFNPLRLAADARQLEFITDLDPNIDVIARHAMYEAMGKSEAEIDHLMGKESIGSASNWGTVVGDETRLRQIVTNLASNACKFTPPGGKLRISTKLVHPVASKRLSLGAQKDVQSPLPLSVDTAYLNEKRQSMHGGDAMEEKHRPVDLIVVRIEVSDTGWGIHPRDMTEAKLFSAFNQTEQGRQQGGKGTGLGLALVRQIVTLSGGRLGVKSKVNEGSTFWVELPLGVGQRALEPSISPPPRSAPSVKLVRIPSPVEHELGSLRESTSTLDGASAPRRSLQLSPAEMRTPAALLRQLGERRGSVDLGLATFHAVPHLHEGEASTSGARPTHHDYEPYDGSSQYGLPYSESKQAPDLVRHAIVADTLNILRETTAFSAESPIPLEAKPAATGDGLRECGLRVLVVDDDPLTRTLMKRMLTRIGCTVDTAENGEVALSMILGEHGPVEDVVRIDEPQAEAGGSSLHLLAPASVSRTVSGSTRNFDATEDELYDVVFMDNQMPVMSGLDVARKLRSTGRRDFVVGVTGNALLSDQNEYLEAGVDKVLTKPVLERSLRQMLLLAQARRQPQPVEPEHPP